MKSSKENSADEPKPALLRFKEGEHYYFENELMVLTAKFLRERGHCCGNGCRHCPYSEEEKAVYKRKSSSSL